MLQPSARQQLSHFGNHIGTNDSAYASLETASEPDMRWEPGLRKMMNRIAVVAQVVSAVDGIEGAKIGPGIKYDA